MKHLIAATAGHVDHGKSALGRELTGSDPDRLPEEKARGITIQLGFAELKLPGIDDGEPVHLGMIDVPGHADFVKNMVAGVGSVDLGLLVVAADDGWMPQTEEHLQILTYLGVTRAVVALTKADLAVDREESIRLVRERLRGSPFANAPVVPTAINDPASLEALRQTLAQVCAAIPSPLDVGKPRLAVDRAFSLYGVGTIVTGTLAGGQLKRGQSVTIQPTGATARIRSMQSHGLELELAMPGQRVALHLSDMPLAVRRGDSGVSRGQVVTAGEIGTASPRWDVLLQSSPRDVSHQGRPVLRNGSVVAVHHGTAAVQARVRLLAKEEMAVGDSAVAQLSFRGPIFGFAGDRFVVRDSSGSRTLAGGVLLDPAASPSLDREAQACLCLKANAPFDLENLLRAELVRDGACLADTVLRQSRWSREAIDAAVQRLIAAGTLVHREDLLADAAWWSGLSDRAKGIIDEEHRAHPDRPGLDLAELRAKLGSVPSHVADVLVAEFSRNGFVREGTTIRRATHRLALPPALKAAGDRIRQVLAAKPFEPPSRKEIAPDVVSLQALRFLVSAGEATEISPELVMASSALDAARKQVTEHIRSSGPATAGELRAALGTNRRVIVPLLEKLDRDGLTRRIGDKRVLRTGQSAS